MFTVSGVSNIGLGADVQERSLCPKSNVTEACAQSTLYNVFLLSYSLFRALEHAFLKTLGLTSGFLRNINKWTSASLSYS